MKTYAVRRPLALSAALLWAGFVCAISFMEAWLKFRAPGITLPLGLGIGRIVFAALNKVEWAFAMAISANFLLTGGGLTFKRHWAYGAAVALLAAQTFWLLPALDARAELHIQGQPVPPSNPRFYYVGMEMAKVACLFAFAFSFFKKNTI